MAGFITQGVPDPHWDAKQEKNIKKLVFLRITYNIYIYIWIYEYIIRLGQIKFKSTQLHYNITTPKGNYDFFVEVDLETLLNPTIQSFKKSEWKPPGAVRDFRMTP